MANAKQDAHDPVVNPEDDKADEKARLIESAEEPSDGLKEDEHFWSRIWVEMNEEWSFYWVLFLAAFDQGSISMSELALKYLYKDDMNLTPATVSFIIGIAAIPWVLKPLWGFISDGVALFGSHRKAYLMLCGLVACSMWTTLATVDSILNNVYVVTTLLVITSVSLAFLSTVAKAIMVEKCEGRSQKYASFVQSYFHIIYYASSLMFAWLGGYMLEHTTKRMIFAITAIAPGLVAIAAIFMHEPVRQRPTGFLHQVRLLVKALSTTNAAMGQTYPLWRPMLFMLIFSSGPTSASAMFYFYTEKLHFDPEFIAAMNMTATGFAVVGILVYQGFLSEARYTSVLLVASLLAIFFGALPIVLVTRYNLVIGIPDDWFMISDQAMTGAIGQVAQFPLLVLGARICPPGVEGTLYALLMSIMNLGAVIGDWMGAGIIALMHISKNDFTNLPYLLVTCSCYGLIPISLLYVLLPSSDSQTIQSHNAERARKGLPQVTLDTSREEKKDDEEKGIEEKGIEEKKQQ